MLSPSTLAGWMLQPSGLLHLKFKQEHLYTSPEFWGKMLYSSSLVEHHIGDAACEGVGSIST